jgi:hypothetical protein
MLPKKIDQYLVGLYRGWHAMEQSRYKNSIVDFDLAPAREFPPISDRQEALRLLQNATSELDGERDKVAILVRARLEASSTYLRGLLGETIAFRRYIEQTLGVEPRMFSEEEIQRQRNIVKEQLLEHYQLQFSKDQIPRFRGRFMIYDKKQLPSQFRLFQSKWVPILLDRIRVPIADYKVNVEFASEDAYWKNWISGNLSKHEIDLRINIHPRQAWYQGFPETLVIHEYCGHAVQMINWHRRIEEEKLPEFLGILTVHFPDQFLLEGLAESLVFVLPGRQELEKDSLVSRELHRHYLLVMNNAHIVANTQGVKKASEFAISNLPFTPPEVIEKEMSDRTENPLYRCYQYVYGMAKETFLNALSGLDFEQKWNLLGVVYDWPMTAPQFSQAASRLATKGKEPEDQNRIADWANQLRAHWNSSHR